MTALRLLRDDEAPESAELEVLQRPYLEPEHNPIAVYAEYEVKHWWFWARRKILRQVVRRLVEPGRGHVIVDVGCGPGGNISCLSDDYACYGVDISQEAIAIARSRHQRVKFIRGIAPDDVSEILRSARLILVMDVIEHLEDDRAALAALIDAAPPGAKFLITVPAGPELWSTHDETVGHYRRYTAESLAEVWAGLGVDVGCVTYFMSLLYPAARLQRGFNRRRHHSSGANGTDLKMPPRPVNDILGRMFAAEGPLLSRAMRVGGRGFRQGLSLMAVLEKPPERKP